MAFKWTEGEHRSGNILDADEFNNSFNAFKGEINGGLDRENLPNTSISNDELASNAMVKYVVKPNIRMQDTDLYTAQWRDNTGGAGTSINQTFRSINYDNYSGGWRTNEAYKINTLFQEGMLHVEYNGWYWLRNHVNTGASNRTSEHLQIWCQFELLLDGNPIVTGGRHYQNVGQVHLVTDVPISTGNHEIALRWRVAANPDAKQTFGVVPTAGPLRPIFYYDGGQITVINRYR
jgi:hypothetical protein